MEQDKSGYENVPPYFLCPITQEIMKNPNINEAGQTYEYASISEWYALGHRTDPCTRMEIKDLRLTLNHVLKSQILEWKENYPKQKLAELEKQMKVRERGDYKLACETYFKLNQKVPSRGCTFVNPECPKLWASAPTAIASAWRRHEEQKRRQMLGSMGHIEKIIQRDFPSALRMLRDSILEALFSHREISLKSLTGPIPSFPSSSVILGGSMRRQCTGKIRDIKRFVHDKKGIPVGQQRLLSNKGTLTDEMKLSELKDLDTILVLLRLRGGCCHEHCISGFCNPFNNCCGFKANREVKQAAERLGITKSSWPRIAEAKDVVPWSVLIRDDAKRKALAVLTGGKKVWLTETSGVDGANVHWKPRKHPSDEEVMSYFAPEWAAGDDTPFVCGLEL
mmetsp:Transcript_16407/g.26636  ORF Transcript_16407/g.26636 Transcript_16407/m.26636 type:complete len:394 (-) Transcript_16407:225-1406(-)